MARVEGAQGRWAKERLKRAAVVLSEREYHLWRRGGIVQEFGAVTMPGVANAIGYGSRDT